MPSNFERLSGTTRQVAEQAWQVGTDPLRRVQEFGREAVGTFTNPRAHAERLAELDRSRQTEVDHMIDRVQEDVGDIDTRRMGELQLCSRALELLRSNPETPAEADLQKLNRISSTLAGLSGFEVEKVGLSQEDTILMAACIYALSD